MTDEQVSVNIKTKTANEFFIFYTFFTLSITRFFSFLFSLPIFRFSRQPEN